MHCSIGNASLPESVVQPEIRRINLLAKSVYFSLQLGVEQWISGITAGLAKIPVHRT